MTDPNDPIVPTPPPEEERQVFEIAIAKAVTGWGVVEVSMAMLFSEMLTGQEGDSRAFAVFYAIENFRSKRKALDDLAAVVLPRVAPPLLKKWKAIDAHLDKRSKKRNKIVHHEILHEESNPPGRRYCLVWGFATETGRRNFASGEMKPMYLHDLNEASKEFNQVGLELRQFMMEVKGASRKPSTPPR